MVPMQITSGSWEQVVLPEVGVLGTGNLETRLPSKS